MWICFIVRNVRSGKGRENSRKFFWKGKIVYNNLQIGISVIYDKNGNYFRIEDTTRPRGRNYLDIDGNDMNNEVVNGKTRGRSRADYQRVTHFNNSDK